MARAPLALLWLCLTAGCVAAPPAELSGFWSASPAACEAGVGVRFGARAIELIHDDAGETLFAHPRYTRERTGNSFRLRIVYDLPRMAGGAYGLGARGEVVLVRLPDGGIAPLTHNILDGRTGAARLRFVGDPGAALLTLKPCGPSPWREALRGRSSGG